MKCQECKEYSKVGQYCLIGKVNPGGLTHARTAIAMFGVLRICRFNDYREVLIEEFILGS